MQEQHDQPFRWALDSDPVSDALQDAHRYLRSKVAMDKSSPDWSPVSAGAAYLAHVPLTLLQGLWDTAAGSYGAYKAGDMDSAGLLGALLAAPATARGIPAAGLGELGAEEAGRKAAIQRGADAVAQMMEEKSDIKAAMAHPEIGDITFRWSTPKGKGGFAHIIEKHGEDAARDVPEIIARGKAGDPYRLAGGGKRRDIVLGSKKVVLAPDWKGDPENWVVTSYDQALGKPPR